MSVLTDANGVVHNIRSDAANISDFHLFSPMLSSILINLRRIEVFADRGYDSKANRTIAYRRGFLPSPHGAKRKCRSSKRQNGKRSPLTSCQSEHTFAWIDNFRRLRVQYEWTPCHKHFFWTLRHAGKAIRLFIRIIASMTCPRDMQHDDSPEDDNNGNSYTAHTYAQSCQTLIPDAEHLAKLQDAVARMHHIKILAGELLCRHIHRCMDERIELPVFSQTWCRQLYKEVSTASRAMHVTTDDPCLTETAEQMQADMAFDRPSRAGLTQLLSLEAISLKTSINLNITRHFKKRLHAFVRWTFHSGERNVMPAAEYARHKLAMLQVTNDLLRPEHNKNLESPSEFHPWIEQYRMFFDLNVLLRNDSFEFVAKVSPQRFLPAMRLINRAFEGSGKHTFSLMPLTRKLRPGFVLLDVTAWSEVLGISPTQSRQASVKASAMRRKQEKLDGTYVSPIEKKALAQQEKEARQLQKESERQERAKLLQNESAAEKKKRMREEKAEREECKRQKQAEAHKKKMADQAAKDEFYATFARAFARQRKKKLRFGHSIRTDGVSARLLYYKEHHKNGKIDNTNVPKRGLYTIDEIKHMSRLREDDMCVIGIDPGKHDLIYAVGDNYLTNSDHRLRYSSAQRRTDRCSTF